MALQSDDAASFRPMRRRVRPHRHPGWPQEGKQSEHAVVGYHLSARQGVTRRVAAHAFARA
eukprot:scaffold1483_cov379-Prasinococcus_capsulatus_cf.AAC.4